MWVASFPGSRGEPGNEARMWGHASLAIKKKFLWYLKLVQAIAPKTCGLYVAKIAAKGRGDLLGFPEFCMKPS